MSKLLKNIFSITEDNGSAVKRKVVRVMGVKFKMKDKSFANFTTLQYLLAMLKKYGIYNAVVSPGTQNANFNYMLQEDKDMNVFSVVDERSAAYMAIGLNNELNSPVIITCTSASASRNYMSALSEAYYKKIPIVAITFFDYVNTKYSVAPQYVDRSVSQNDIKYIDVELPRILDENDKKKCLTLLNVALSSAKHKNLPVHINCPSGLDFSDEKTKILPDDIWASEYYSINFDNLKSELKDKNIAIYIGSHRKFTDSQLSALSEFAKSYNAPVFCDHVGHYKGANRVMVAQAFGMIKLKNKPDLVIDIGDVSGEYYANTLLSNTKIWRISEDGQFKFRFNFPVDKFFDCREEYFFSLLKNDTPNSTGYYQLVKEEVDKIVVPELPLCNSLIVQNLAKNIPNNSSLHHSVSNTKRNMNFCEFDDSVEVNCNVGVCGIDGPVSTMVGQSLASKDRKVFGILGDLAFFYDMNAIGQRNISNNLRIILINNGRGEEFRLNPRLEKQIGEKTDFLIAAQGHNKGGVKGWATSCGFEYMTASTKEEFLNQIGKFCNDECDKPVIFEIFTNDEDEKKGLHLMQNYNK